MDPRTTRIIQCDFHSCRLRSGVGEADVGAEGTRFLTETDQPRRLALVQSFTGCEAVLGGAECAIVGLVVDPGQELQRLALADLQRALAFDTHHPDDIFEYELDARSDHAVHRVVADCPVENEGQVGC